VKIALANVYVDDQEKALRFYTDVLGFEKKNDFPVGGARWVTVVSPQDPDGVELVLEPNGTPVAKAYQDGVYSGGMPAAVFSVDDIHAEYQRLTSLGVTFNGEPTAMGPVITAMLDDTCGNLVQLVQPVSA
jgi:catechol 2,3-dioxygenase-like lactoylglutathione lyase family enzyme